METIFSIIIPHYNSPDALNKLLQGIIGYEDTEIIVIDDSSTKYLDELDYCMKKYSNKVLFLENNSGNNSAGICRNIGLEKAKGKWLLFADADDYFVEGWHEIIEKHKNDVSDIIYYVPTSLNLITNNEGNRHKAYVGLVERYKKNDSKAESRLKYSFVVPWSKMIRSEIVIKNNIQFDETLYSNDVMFSVRSAYCAKTVEAVKETIYCVTESKTSLTKNVGAEALRIRTLVGVERYCFLKERLHPNDFNCLTDVQIEPAKRISQAASTDLGWSLVVEFFRLFHKEKVSVSRGIFHWLLNKL